MSKRGSTAQAEPASKRRKDEKPTGWEEAFVGDFAPVWDAAYAEDPEKKKGAQLRWLGTLMSEKTGDLSSDQATFDCLLQSFLNFDPERLCNPLAVAKKQLASVKAVKAQEGLETAPVLYFNGATLPLKAGTPFLIGRSYDDHSALGLNLRGLVSEGVSRLHSEISFSPQTKLWTLRSLCSLGPASCGLLLNGKTVSSASLHRGDVIRIGSILLSFF